MDRDEALRRLERIGVVAIEIIAERAHQLRAARPDRIGMLALDLGEKLRRLLVLITIEPLARGGVERARSEEHTSELQSLMRISYAVFCLKKKTETNLNRITKTYNTKHTTTHK